MIIGIVLLIVCVAAWVNYFLGYQRGYHQALILKTGTFVNALDEIRASDEKMQRQLPGTWGSDSPRGVHETCTICVDGSYFAQFTGYKNGRVLFMEGKFRIKDRILIETVTKYSDTNVTVPFEGHECIILMNDHEIVLKPEFAADDSMKILRKVE
jgi:hypothetical protein